MEEVKEEKKLEETMENESEMKLFDDTDDLEAVKIKDNTLEKKENDKVIDEKRADSYSKNGDVTVTAAPIESKAVKEEKAKSKKKRTAKKKEIKEAVGNNVLKISGMVVNKYEQNGSGPVKLTVVVDPQNGQDADFPVVFAFRDHTDNTTIADNILVKDHVTVTGHASSYTRRTGNGTPGVFVQEIAADSIEKQTPTYPEQIGDTKGRPHYETANAFVFNGTVMQISKMPKNVTILRVRMEQEGHTNTVDVTVFGHGADRISVGEKVTASGRVTTQRKKYGDKNVRFFQNFVAQHVTAQPDEKTKGKEEA